MTSPAHSQGCRFESTVTMHLLALLQCVAHSAPPYDAVLKLLWRFHEGETDVSRSPQA
jgi:hypothetical protein